MCDPSTNISGFAHNIIAGKFTPYHQTSSKYPFDSSRCFSGDCWLYRNYLTTVPAPISRPFLHISLQIYVHTDRSESAIISPPQTNSIVGKNAFDVLKWRPPRQSNHREVNNNNKVRKTLWRGWRGELKFWQLQIHRCLNQKGRKE